MWAVSVRTEAHSETFGYGRQLVTRTRHSLKVVMPINRYKPLCRCRKQGGPSTNRSVGRSTGPGRYRVFRFSWSVVSKKLKNPCQAGGGSRLLPLRAARVVAQCGTKDGTTDVRIEVRSSVDVSRALAALPGRVFSARWTMPSAVSAPCLAHPTPRVGHALRFRSRQSVCISSIKAANARHLTDRRRAFFVSQRSTFWCLESPSPAWRRLKACS